MEDLNLTLNMDDLNFNDPNRPAAEDNDIMVVGVGGGGGNAVNHMFRQDVKKVTFVVCNTDKTAVLSSPVPNKVIIGDGKGAGNKPEKARKFAEDDIDKINAIFDGPAKMVFITAGMGGGTGTGAGPVVARVAKERGLLTIGIVTIPFVFEGRKKIMKALEGADEMAKYVDALLIINNERLAEIYPDLDFINAFGKADDTLSTAARSISEIINVEGYINLDFNDVDTTLRDGGTAIISTGYGEGEGRVTKAIQAALNSPLLKNHDINGSKKLLMNLYLSNEEGHSMSMDEISELKHFVAGINPEVDVIWGATIDNELGNKVKITILAAGFDITIRDEEEQILVESSRPVGKKEPSPADVNQRVKIEYGGGLDELGANYIILTPEQFDDDNVIEILETSPAFNREKRVLDRLKNLSSSARPANPSSSSSSPSGGQINFLAD